LAIFFDFSAASAASGGMRVLFIQRSTFLLCVEPKLGIDREPNLPPKYRQPEKKALVTKKRKLFRPIFRRHCFRLFV
jgi:hypothetical protein